ncbi:MAG: hypothetical protein ACMUHU_07730 [Thermoplasmatota archaeon]
MAMMNRVGALLYNLCLFLTVGIVFLALKNFNFKSPEDTLDYGDTLKFLLFGMIWFYYAFAFALTISAFISKARKKRFMFSFMMVWLWLAIAFNALYTFILPELLKPEYTTPFYRYSFIVASICLAFVPAMGLIFYQFPGSVDRNILINDLKKKIVKEKQKASSYCPICKYPSEKEWKHCPKCGAHFSD